MSATTYRRALSTLPLLALACLHPAPTLRAQGLPACATAWNAGTAYNGGDTSSKNSTNYQANWWTQGQDPATNSGPGGSGQPWTSQGACTGDGTTVIDPIFKDSFDTGGGGPLPSGFIFSPYKDITVNLNWNTNAMRTAASGSLTPLVGNGGLIPSQINLPAITLAFATGTCGSENWGGIQPQAFIDANLPALSAAGVGYVISTGGAAGTFTCPTGDALKAFIAKYSTPHLLGIDFDIEGGQTPSQITALVNAAAAAQVQYPNLRFSFTLATLAASDGSWGGLNSVGDATVRAIQASALTHYTINLMVMDFGGPSAAVCVVSGGHCDMGQSAIQAAKNLMHTYGIAPAKIELTPMIGMNDVSNEVFSASDVDTMMQYALTQGMAGVHFWSLDRDTPCPGPSSSASPTCNSVAGTTPLQYGKRFLLQLGL